LNFSDISFSSPSDVKLFHFEGGSWIDVTVSLDTINNIVCGSVTSLSPFAVFQSSARQLTALGPASVWVGLKNSDDVGIKFDLLAEVLKNGTVVGSGQVNGVPGGSSGFNNAILRTIALALPSSVGFGSSDTLGFRLSVRSAVNVTGHPRGTARLWFNDSAANSRFRATISGSANDYYLTGTTSPATFALSKNAPGTGPKRTVDVLVDRNAGGNPFKPFGTWTTATP
jgi:hypothetical protein